MSTIKLSALSAVAFLCATALLAGRSGADEALTAHLLDGRVVTGTVDERTDAQYLWLRRTAEQVDLASGYAWDEVLEGRVAGQTLGNPELRMWALARKQPGRRFAEIASALQSDSRMLSVPPPPLPAAPLHSVKTLVIDAELAQWDKDARTDGLRIFVYPLDAHGNVVPIEGHIEFTLVVEREYARGGRSNVQVPEFIEGDRLSFQVRREHFGTGPAFYELAFSKWHPEFELTLAHQALLFARLSVPGEGVFEASDARVCVREPSRFRDQLQLYSRGRYLPLENPSRDGR